MIIFNSRMEAQLRREPDQAPKGPCRELWDQGKGSFLFQQNPTLMPRGAHPGQLFLVRLRQPLLGVPLLLIVEDGLGHLILRLTV